MVYLEHWHGEMMATAQHAVDPLWTVRREGGPYHTRGPLDRYGEHLRATGRADGAERVEARHGT